MLIINGKVLTMAGESFEKGYVYIKKDKIMAVGEMKDLSPDLQKGEYILDASDTWVMPGLIDAHCHVGIAEEKWGMIGDDTNENTSPITPQLRAITINAAKICGVSDRVGSLEVGKDADIAIFTGNPMETWTRTLYTIVSGEVVYKE